MSDEDLGLVPRHKIDIVLLRAQIELLQRVNKLVELLESEYGKRKARESDQEPTVVASSKGLEASVLEDRTQGTKARH
jgi:hypothetical protein